MLIVEVNGRWYGTVVVNAALCSTLSDRRTLFYDQDVILYTLFFGIFMMVLFIIFKGFIVFIDMLFAYIMIVKQMLFVFSEKHIMFRTYVNCHEGSCM